jgi:4-amino-4-deoxy-L-arabinose transferase-like glycosyltransferase
MKFVHVPVDRDEGSYAYIAQEILRGSTPYEDMIAMRPPGIFYIYALIFSIAGAGVEQLRLATDLYVLLTVYVIYLTARRLWGAVTGLVAALLYAIFSNGPIVEGFGSNTEVFMALPRVLMIYLLLRWIDEGKRHLLVLCGLCAGLAMMIKQVALPGAVLVALYLLVPWLRKRRMSAVAADLLAYAAPSFVLLLVLSTYLMLNSAFDDFFYWTFIYPFKYSSEGLGNFIGRLSTRGLETSLEFLLLWVLGLPAACWILWKHNTWKACLIVFFMVSSFIGVSMPGKFYPHYFILMLAPLSLLSALALRELWSIKRIVFYTSIPIMLAALAVTLKMDYRYYLDYSPDQISIAKFGDVFVEASRVAAYVKSRTTAEDYIFQWGFEPEIYFMADRRCPNKFIFHTHIEGAEDINEAITEMMTSLVFRRPVYMLVQSGRETWTGYDEVMIFIFTFYRYENTIGNYTIYRLI